MRRSHQIAFILIITLAASLFGGMVTPVLAQANIQVVSDSASLTFPDSIDFNAEFQASDNITSVVLEYGVNQLTCGTVDAKAFPSVTAGTDVKVTWTWQMLESGSLPPGATVWWQWQVTDASGSQFTSPTQTVLWLDSVHQWKVITGGNINLHYYNGSASFGQQLHDAATQALVRLSQDVGVSTDSSVDIYIYANSDDLQSSILYAPSWVGGQAFPESNIVIIGIPTDQLTWGKSTEAHELTHVLVGHLTFSCLGFIPTWLNEGLAMYGEGGVQAAEQAQFDQAKTNNQLPSLRSLTGAFSAEATRATLSYTEAYSVVDFMIKTYGRDKMTSLLLDLKNGDTIDEALQAVYGFKTDGLENAWRTSIGATPLSGGAQATPIPTPTIVPTYVPIGAAPIAQAQIATAQATPNTSNPTSEPTVTFFSTPTNGNSTPVSVPTVSSRSFSIILGIGVACLVLLVIIAGLIAFLLIRRNNRRQQ